MKKILFHPSLKGIAFAIPLFVLFACCSAVFAQPVIVNSNCFTIVNDTSRYICDTAGRFMWCNIEPGGTNLHKCVHCRTFILKMDKCTGINPTTFTVVSNSSTDCHSVCSPDFAITNDLSSEPFPWCSWYNPRVMTASTGIPDMGSVKFTICYADGGPHTYTISLPTGTSCGGIPCTSASITF